MMRWLLGCWLMLMMPAMGWALEEAQLQQFIDEATKAGGGEVVIPPGVHVIKKGLKMVDAKGVKLAGMDKERSVLKWEGEGPGVLIEVNGKVEKIGVSKLTLIGNGKGATGVVLGTTEGTGVELVDCLFEDGLQTGLVVGASEGTVVERCSLRDVAGAGIEVKAGAKGVVIVGNWLARCATGVVIAEGAQATIKANEFFDVALAVKTEGDGKNSLVENNAIHGGVGIKVQAE